MKKVNGMIASETENRLYEWLLKYYEKDDIQRQKAYGFRDCNNKYIEYVADFYIKSKEMIIECKDSIDNYTLWKIRGLIKADKTLTKGIVYTAREKRFFYANKTQYGEKFQSAAFYKDNTGAFNFTYECKERLNYAYICAKENGCIILDFREELDLYSETIENEKSEEKKGYCSKKKTYGMQIDNILLSTIQIYCKTNKLKISSVANMIFADYAKKIDPNGEYKQKAIEIAKIKGDLD